MKFLARHLPFPIGIVLNSSSCLALLYELLYIATLHFCWRFSAARRMKNLLLQLMHLQKDCWCFFAALRQLEML